VHEEAALLRVLVGLPQRHGSVLLYTTDASADFCSRYAGELRAAGYLLTIPPPITFELGFDKAALARECAIAGVPTIPTREVTTEAEAIAAYRSLAAEAPGERIILKPTRLAGGKYIIMDSEADVAGAFAQQHALVTAPENLHIRSGIIAQQFIRYNYNDLYCCESVYTQEAKPAVGFWSVRKTRPNINRDGTPGSRLFAGEAIQNERLERYTEQILTHLGWTGFAHLDWIYDPQRAEFLLSEINPRLPGFSNFPHKMGFEMAWQYYADLCGLPQNPFVFKPAVYFEALRIPGDLSNSIVSVAKRQVPWKDFWGSYRKGFSNDYARVIDPWFPGDGAFTRAYLAYHLRYLLLRPFKR
jgi:predicted ATP-grasp superfamily ATP-dependent carboligase